ncbi:hypothetical protein [Rhizobium leguminosarum]|uniref:hypothetical protein n=1 Tax=Rhizobium TaxID=379 RepID=UPI001FF02CF7|nr:hypothetical protein [Rhizobium leguminosarum]
MIQQIGMRGKIPISGADMIVPEIGRKLRQSPLNVLTIPVPGQQRSNGEGVAEIVYPGTVTFIRLPQSRLACPEDKGEVWVGMDQGPAKVSGKEVFANPSDRVIVTD